MLEEIVICWQNQENRVDEAELSSPILLSSEAVIVPHAIRDCGASWRRTELIP